MKDPFRSIQLYLQQGTRKIFQRSNLRLAAFHQKWLLNVNRYECSLHVSFIAVRSGELVVVEEEEEKEDQE